jgi:AbrB family looped-hinge helix DNA binding protein
MQTVKMSTKGQVIIPAKFRKKYGLKKGERLIFIEEEDHLLLKPRTKLTELCGSVKPELSMNEARKKIREMRENW